MVKVFGLVEVESDAGQEGYPYSRGGEVLRRGCQVAAALPEKGRPTIVSDAALKEEKKMVQTRRRRRGVEPAEEKAMDDDVGAGDIKKVGDV